MRAIIIAAGKAPRMLPITRDIPVCMIKVGNKTILERQVEALKKSGISEIIVVVGHKSKQVEELSKKLKIQTIYNPFYEVSGMAITLWIAKDYINDDFIFLYSDILFDSKIISNIIKSKNNIALAVKRNGTRFEGENIIESDGTIKCISKKVTDATSAEFIGIAYFSKGVCAKLKQELDNISRINLFGSFIDVINNMIGNKETVYTSEIDDMKWVDIDFPEDIKKAENLFR